MPALDPASALAMLAALLLISWMLVQRRRAAGRRAPRPASSLPPTLQVQAVRILTSSERQAHTLLSQAMPGTLVLAQVPLTRFLRVDTTQVQWLQQAAGLSADLLLCDSSARVMAVVTVRSPRASANSRKRHDKKGRLLKLAGLKVLSWNEDALPDIAQVRSQLLALLAPNAVQRSGQAVPSRAMPLIPVAEVLDDGDSGHNDAAMEPVPSALFDELAPDLALPKKH